jgi:hypothetical protein
MASVGNFPINDREVGTFFLEVLVEPSGMQMRHEGVFLAVSQKERDLEALAEAKGVIYVFPSGAIRAIPARQKPVFRV